MHLTNVVPLRHPCPAWYITLAAPPDTAASAQPDARYEDLSATTDPIEIIPQGTRDGFYKIPSFLKQAHVTLYATGRLAIGHPNPAGRFDPAQPHVILSTNTLPDPADVDANTPHYWRLTPCPDHPYANPDQYSCPAIKAVTHAIDTHLAPTISKFPPELDAWLAAVPTHPLYLYAHAPHTDGSVPRLRLRRTMEGRVDLHVLRPIPNVPILEETQYLHLPFNRIEDEPDTDDHPPDTYWYPLGQSGPDGDHASLPAILHATWPMLTAPDHGPHFQPEASAAPHGDPPTMEPHAWVNKWPHCMQLRIAGWRPVEVLDSSAPEFGPLAAGAIGGPGMHRHLPQNPHPKGRDFLTGDVHGEFELLQQLLDHIGFEPDRDRLICSGDMVKRVGTETPAFLVHPWFYSTRGNHEQERIDRRGHSGGLQSDDDLQPLCDLPVAITLDSAWGRIGIVHADMPPDRTWAEFCSALCNGVRGDLMYALYSRVQAPKAPADLYALIYGHDRHKEPVWSGLGLGIDFNEYECLASVVELATLQWQWHWYKHPDGNWDAPPEFGSTPVPLRPDDPSADQDPRHPSSRRYW